MARSLLYCGCSYRLIFEIYLKFMLQLCRLLGYCALQTSPLPSCHKKVRKSGPVTRHGGALGERRYSSYSFLISALEGGEWSASRRGRALPPGKEPPVPTVQESGWAPQPVWTQRLEEKSSAIARCHLQCGPATKRSSNQPRKDLFVAPGPNLIRVTD
jgi:hypothetical protein